MDILTRLEKIVNLGRKISKFSEQDKETVILFINKWIMSSFNEEEYDLLISKYAIKYKIKIDDCIKDLLRDKEVLKLLLTSILHPN